MNIATPSLTDQVADALIRRIADGEYAVGGKLPSGRLLAQEFQVSPAVIREATERLRTKGLIRSRQGAGCTILASTANDGFLLKLPDRIDKQELLQIYELRYDIEGGAAALAALRATKQDIREMSRILASLHESLLLPEQALAWDVAFHQAMATATHNPHYTQLLGYLTDQWRNSVRAARLHTLAISRSGGQAAAQGKPAPPGKPVAEPQPATLPEQVHQEHVAVLQAVSARNPAAARAAAQAHMRNACERLGLDTSSFHS